LAALFNRLTIIRPSLQNSVNGACIANIIQVLWDQLKLTD